MSEDEVAAYRKRLTDEVAGWIDEIERCTDDRFGLAIAHHCFMNTVVLRDVIRRRAAAGRGRMPLLRVRPRHRAEDVQQREARRQPGGVPAAVPAVHAEREDLRLRRPRARRRRGRRDLAGAGRGARRRVPGVPRDRVVLSHNGYNQDVFQVQPGVVRRPRQGAGRVQPRRPPEGSGRAPEPVAPPTGSTPSSRSAASSRTGSGSTRCCAPPRPTSSGRTRRSSPWWRARGRSRPRCRCTTSPPSSACAAPTSSAHASRTS